MKPSKVTFVQAKSELGYIIRNLPNPRPENQIELIKLINGILKNKEKTEYKNRVKKYILTIFFLLFVVFFLIFDKFVNIF